MGSEDTGAGDEEFDEDIPPSPATIRSQVSNCPEEPKKNGEGRLQLILIRPAAIINSSILSKRELRSVADRDDGEHEDDNLSAFGSRAEGTNEEGQGGKRAYVGR
ncbi:unnamed protein product [Zymoseptoria tritici ST99CH_1E4]|uniref:Uncharacterized protein n=1 Tax=Zymoseptoria tritici ST99CH_1E4 TaxID=1276532 RepID=A0A2H1H9Z3_ZYMTR|nr:unnamed protein product [Zymoseptoria tritici ST99CH_1E4]